MNPNETLREKLIRCGWATNFNVDTLVKLIEKHCEEKDLKLDIDKRPLRFIMSPELAEDMQEIEDITGMSRTEIFRRAIVLYKRAKQIEKDKGNILLRNSDGTLREIVGF
jgi:hypothetical protein